MEPPTRARSGSAPGAPPGPGASPARLRVGLVSDTHGLFDASLPKLLVGCDLVLHAGDVVAPEILGRLAAIAPVRAVRGNNDVSPGFAHLPEVDVVALGPLVAVLTHQGVAHGRTLPGARRALAARRAQILVYGHSHRPEATLREGVLHVNPGSAGPRRFSLPRSAGLLDVDGRTAVVRLFDLAADGTPLLAPPVRASW